MSQEFPLPDPGDETDPLTLALSLGQALNAHGVPAHRLEAALTQLLEKMGIAAHFFVVPTALFAAYGVPPRNHSHFVRVEPGEVNLEKLVQLDQVVGAIYRGALTNAEGLRWVHRVVSARVRYGLVSTVLSYALVSASVAVFFDGGWREIVASTGIGLLVGLLGRFTASRQSLSRIHDALAAFLAVLIATAVAWYITPVNVMLVALSGIIVLVPGLTLTTAMTELSTRNWVCGTARMAGAMEGLVKLTLGVALGSRVGDMIMGTARLPHRPDLPLWYQVAALVAVSLGFVVVLRARPRDTIWIVMACFVAYWGSRFGARLFGSELGAFTGAVLVGMGSNLFARVVNRPASVPLVPGLLLLVPGSIGFHSMTSLLHGEVVSGVETAFSALLVAISLAAGLLVANALVSPRKTL